MDLFEVRDGRAFPVTHALMIKPFKTIWEQDETEDKGEAIKMLSFIELFCSPKKSNPYHGYSEDERYIKLKEEIYDDAQYELSYLVTDGIIKYENLLENASPTYSLLRTCEQTTERLKEALTTIDINERTRSGGAVYKPKDITGALSEIADVAKNIETLREKVTQELLAETKTRNSREPGYFER